MGAFAEDAVREYQFTREQQDEYALRSLSRANAAIAGDGFAREITPVTVPGPEIYMALQTGDGKFHVEGDGFLWRQNDQLLIISNNVHTVIKSGVLQFSPP